MIELPADVVADLRHLEQKRVQFVLATALGNLTNRARALQELLLVAGALTEYIPADAPVQESTRG